MKRVKKQKGVVGVDFRVVIISGLIVGMLLVQLVLVEAYGEKKTVTLPPLNIQAASITKSQQAKIEVKELDEDDYDSTTLLTSSQVQIESSIVHTTIETSSPTSLQAENVDIANLERQLKELQTIHDDDEETLEIHEVQQQINQDVSESVTTTPVTTVATTTTLPAPPQLEFTEEKLPPPIYSEVFDKEASLVLHSKSSSVSSSSSSSSSSTASVSVVAASTSTSSASSSSHLTKGCKARQHLFRSYKSPLRIVYFPSIIGEGVMDPLWKSAFRELGYQETENAALSTFIISKYSSDTKSREFCGDSQMFNHIKGGKVFTNQILLSKYVAKVNSAARFHPESSFYGGTSLSSSSRKLVCAAFIRKLTDLLKQQPNVLLAAFSEKHEQNKVNKISISSLMKIVDLYRKSSLCPHSDDVLAILAFRNILLLEKGKVLCSPRVFMYLPTMRPFMMFVNIEHIIIRCGSIRSFDYFSSPSSSSNSSSSTTTTGSDIQTSSITLLSLIQFRDRLIADGKLTLEDSGIVLKEFINQIKRSIAETSNAIRQKLENLNGRFGYYAVDFVLDSHNLRPIIVKIVGTPEISTMNFAPIWIHQATKKMFVEMIQSQHIILKRSWLNSKKILTPEDLHPLDSFELCAYESTESSTLRIFPFLN